VPVFTAEGDERRTVQVVLFALLAAVAATVSPALTRPAAAETSSDVGADFNNDGFVDLAVGVPGENDFAAR
jgi:hypothetical protein